MCVAFPSPSFRYLFVWFWTSFPTLKGIPLDFFRPVRRKDPSLPSVPPVPPAKDGVAPDVVVGSDSGATLVSLDRHDARPSTSRVKDRKRTKCGMILRPKGRKGTSAIGTY